MPRDYLLDTNVVSTLANPAHKDYAHVKGKYDAIPADAIVALPVMGISEIEFGMVKAKAADPAQQAAVRKFFTDHPLHYGFDDQTVKPYSLVRAQLWNLYGTLKTGKRHSHQEKLPDELRDRGTAKWIGIDERDLLIVSVALQFDLTFATKDRNAEMRRIESAVNAVVAAGDWPEHLHLEDWTPPPSPPATAAGS
jgi:predicted nucleic acid-binding protein